MRQEKAVEEQFHAETSTLGKKPTARVAKTIEAPRPTGTGALEGHLLFNRELRWLEFNRRVLEEALDHSQPLLERLKFLAIFSTNLDEFFMIRVSGLMQQVDADVTVLSPDGLSPAAQLKAISEKLKPMIEKHAHCLK